MQLQERQFLKDEMQDLKSCQVRYFSITVTATGVLLGLGGELGMRAVYFLAPLIIILPCWLIFFDKATSITRITGYTKYLESFILKMNIDAKYIGWENALSIFRMMHKPPSDNTVVNRLKTTLSSAGKALAAIAMFNFEYRYWKITWVVFFMLSVICLLSGIVEFLKAPDCTRGLLFGVALMFVLLTVVHTLYLLQNLISGKFSYRRNGEMWRECLRPSVIEKYLEAELGIVMSNDKG